MGLRSSAFARVKPYAAVRSSAQAGYCRRLPVEASHGLHIFVGPTRSGKSLLSHHIAHQFVGEVCHECAPGRPSQCYEQGGLPYVVVTNERSEKVLKWARPIRSLTELDIPGAHVVALIDEGYLISDARRSQSGLNMEMSGIVAQAGKDGVRVYYTSQTLRKADVRLREDAKYFWDCWNPDGMGLRVYAVLTTGADGTIPRWERDNIPPQIMHFDTAHSRQYYDSWEKIDQYAIQRSSRKAVTVRVEEGGFGRLKVSTLAESALNELIAADEHIEDGFVHASYITAAANTMAAFNPPLTEEEIVAGLMENFHVPDGDRRFWIGAVWQEAKDVEQGAMM